MGLPSVDAETLAAYFHPLLPETWDDPVIGPVLRRLQETAPLAIGDAKLDVLCELDAGAGYDELLPDSEVKPFHGRKLHVLGLRRLIQAKAAAGRPKDQMALPILLATLEARERGK